MKADDSGIFLRIDTDERTEFSLELLLAKACNRRQIAHRCLRKAKNPPHGSINPVDFTKRFGLTAGKSCQKPVFDEIYGGFIASTIENPFRKFVQTSVLEIIARCFNVIEERRWDVKKRAHGMRMKNDDNHIQIAFGKQMRREVNLSAYCKSVLRDAKFGDIERLFPVEDNLCAPEGKRQRIQPHIASESPIETNKGLQHSARLVKFKIILNHSTKLTYFSSEWQKTCSIITNYYCF